jgi:hypothetical protein
MDAGPADILVIASRYGPFKVGVAPHESPASAYDGPPSAGAAGVIGCPAVAKTLQGERSSYLSTYYGNCPKSCSVVEFALPTLRLLTEFSADYKTPTRNCDNVRNPAANPLWGFAIYAGNLNEMLMLGT